MGCYIWFVLVKFDGNWTDFLFELIFIIQTDFLERGLIIALGISPNKHVNNNDQGR